MYRYRSKINGAKGSLHITRDIAVDDGEEYQKIMIKLLCLCSGKNEKQLMKFLE